MKPFILDYSRFSDRRLLALYRVAKTRCYFLYRNPYEMRRLRGEVQGRGLV